MPTLVNNVEGGRTPFLPVDELESLGFRLAIYPNSLTRLFCRIGLEMLDELKSSGSTEAFRDRMLTHGELWDLFDVGSWEGLEKKYTSPSRG